MLWVGMGSFRPKGGGSGWILMAPGWLVPGCPASFPSAELCQQNGWLGSLPSGNIYTSYCLANCPSHPLPVHALSAWVSAFNFHWFQWVMALDQAQYFHSCVTHEAWDRAMEEQHIKASMLTGAPFCDCADIQGMEKLHPNHPVYLLWVLLAVPRLSSLIDWLVGCGERGGEGKQGDQTWFLISLVLEGCIHKASFVPLTKHPCYLMVAGLMMIGVTEFQLVGGKTWGKSISFTPSFWASQKYLQLLWEIGCWPSSMFQQTPNFKYKCDHGLCNYGYHRAVFPHLPTTICGT